MYSITWDTDAENELAAIWMAAGDQVAVTAAANGIEQALARDPLHVGESRIASVHRVVFSPPLAVEYEVIEDDKRVLVHAVYVLN